MTALALVFSGCSSEEEARLAADESLLVDYWKSTEVQNDRFPSPPDFGSRDRQANFAAHYTAEQLQSELLSAFPCEDDPDCDLNADVNEAIRDFAGAEATVYGRSILVKHDDDSLELITLYVVRRADDTAALVDSTGETHSGDLDNFREHNDLLDADDLILAPRNLTAVPGEGRIVTVSGHTASGSPPWLVGGSGAAVALVVGFAVTRLFLARRASNDLGLTADEEGERSVG
jgi:hypothetical protein